MKQDIFIIHGGSAFKQYEDYISHLKNKEVSRERLKRQDWKMELDTTLDGSFEIFLPKMPNPQNARYSEWKIWFERLIPLINENVILVGHSLGGIFLAKYLSEELFPKKIRATLLIAAPFNTAQDTFHTPEEPSLADFILPDQLNKLTEQGGTIFLFQSKDDPVVPYDNVEKYQRALPGAQSVIFDDKGHFNESDFPMLVDILKKIVSTAT